MFDCSICLSITAARMSEIDVLQEMRKSIDLETARDSINNRMSLTRSTSNTTLFGFEDVLQVSINVSPVVLSSILH